MEVFSEIMRQYYLILVVVHIYFGAVLLGLSRQVGAKDTWRAWVPVMNFLLLCEIANKPGCSTYILMMIPIVNIFVNVGIWMSIAERLGHPKWMGILMIVPLVNFLVPLYFAFAPAPLAVAPPPTPSAPWSAPATSHTAAPTGAACPSCGTPAQPGDTFCGGCGGSLTAGAIPQTASPVSPVYTSPPAVTPANPAQPPAPPAPGAVPASVWLPRQPPSPTGGAPPVSPPGGQATGAVGPVIVVGSTVSAPCSRCGASVPAGKRFCPQCGGAASAGPAAVAQPGAQSCPNPQCGKRIPAGKKFCAACGTRLA